MKLLPNLITLLLSFSLFSQQTKISNSIWNVEDPFKTNVFIENKGQFDDAELTNEKIWFGTNQMGMNIAFTNTGIYYRIQKYKNSYDKEKEGKPSEEPKETKEEKLITSVLYQKFLGANTNVIISAEDKASDYNTYVDKKSSNALYPNTIIANGFKKIIYKNIYPNIDLEYTIHQKGGLKYSFILHPGADASLIQMQYKHSKKIALNSSNDLEITYNKEKIIDHKPYSFYQNSKSAIKSSFAINNNIVSFTLENYDNSKTVIIDPWIINPLFTTTNSGYDIAKDATNNVYVSGGDPPYALKKFSPAGALLWTYNYPFTTFGNYYYGDFCLDNSGNIFIGYGLWNGQISKKLNAATATVIFHNTAGSPSYPQGETYRVVYNTVSNKVIGVGFCYDGINLLNRTSVY